MKIAAIVPAFNEEKTIGPILKELCNMKILDEIIVVSDGSTDNTVAIARNYVKDYKVKVIEHKENMGKSQAVITGVNNTKAEIIIMLDADLIGLKESHIMALLSPIINEDVTMTVGIFNHGRGSTDLAQKIAPFLSGQRAVKREVFEKLHNYSIKDYGIEMALTLLANTEKIKTKEVKLNNLTHVMKEEKRGILVGFLSRIKMYWDIILCLIKFKFRGVLNAL